MRPARLELKITDAIQNKKLQEINPGTFASVIILVGPARENSNYLFESLLMLCERLDELDIEAIMEVDQQKS